MPGCLAATCNTTTCTTTHRPHTPHLLEDGGDGGVGAAGLPRGLHVRHVGAGARHVHVQAVVGAPEAAGEGEGAAAVVGAVAQNLLAEAAGGLGGGEEGVTRAAAWCAKT